MPREEAEAKRKKIQAENYASILKNVFSHLSPNITSTIIRKIYHNSIDWNNTPATITNKILNMNDHGRQVGATYYKKL